MYCSVAEVYRAGQLDNTVVDEASVTDFIKASEREVNRLTFTTYFVEEDKGTLSSATDEELTDDSKTWETDELKGLYVYLYSGTGSGQVRRIISNTTDTMSVDTLSSIPDHSTHYKVLYTAENPIIGDERLDGTGTSVFFVPQIPILDIESLGIYLDNNKTEISLDNLYIYKRIGKLILKHGSETPYFWAKPQSVDLKYTFGVFIPEEVKRFVIVASAERMLSAQMGSTYNVPSTYSLPEGSVSIGQAYINIDSTAKRLYQEKQNLIKMLEKYPVLQ